MGALNKFNHYSFQDIQTARPVIESMLLKKRRLKTIFTFLRNEARWDAIGDFPILANICSVAQSVGHQLSAREVTAMFRISDEFKDIRQNNQLILQVCASITPQDSRRENKKQRTDKV